MSYTVEGAEWKEITKIKRIRRVGLKNHLISSINPFLKLRRREIMTEILPLFLFICLSF
jgi:hypothetical protein